MTLQSSWNVCGLPRRDRLHAVSKTVAEGHRLDEEFDRIAEYYEPHLRGVVLVPGDSFPAELLQGLAGERSAKELGGSSRLSPLTPKA